LLQDIINDDEIKLDWLFKASLVHDIVKVSDCNLLPTTDIKKLTICGLQHF